MRPKIAMTSFNKKFKVVKQSECYYLYIRKFYFLWVTNGIGYQSRSEAVSYIPYER